MKITRRQAASGLAALSLSAVPLLRRPAAAIAAGTTITIKLGHTYSETHPLNIRLKEAADRIRQESAGQLNLQLFPNSSLGPDPQMVEQVRSGALDMVATTVLYLESMMPQVNASGLGFAFKTLETAWAAWDGAFGAYFRKNFPSKTGMLIIGSKNFDNGFRDVTSNRPINSPADLKGLKIRVPHEEILESLFASLGASPTPLQIKEVFSALQTHVVDAQENDLAHIEFWKFYEVQKYVSLTNHIWDGMWPFMNPQSYNKLPGNLQGILTRNIDKAALDQRVDMKALNLSLRGKLHDKGMTVTVPDSGPFRDALRQSGYYKEWKKKIGPEVWPLLEKYSGPLG